MRQNIVVSTKKYEKFSGDGAPFPDPSPSGEGDTPPHVMPLPISLPSRRLRHLDPSHSKILGTPLNH